MNSGVHTRLRERLKRSAKGRKRYRSCSNSVFYCVINLRNCIFCLRDAPRVAKAENAISKVPTLRNCMFCLRDAPRVAKAENAISKADRISSLAYVTECVCYVGCMYRAAGLCSCLAVREVFGLSRGAMLRIATPTELLFGGGSGLFGDAAKGVAGNKTCVQRQCSNKGRRPVSRENRSVPASVRARGSDVVGVTATVGLTTSRSQTVQSIRRQPGKSGQCRKRRLVANQTGLKRLKKGPSDRPGPMTEEDVEALVGSVGESVLEHSQRHRPPLPHCARCVWSAWGAHWRKKQGSFFHESHGDRERLEWVGERTEKRQGAWALGCVVCAQALYRLSKEKEFGSRRGNIRVNTKWAKFVVPSFVQASSLANPANSTVHKLGH